MSRTIIARGAAAAAAVMLALTACGGTDEAPEEGAGAGAAQEQEADGAADEEGAEGEGAEDDGAAEEGADADAEADGEDGESEDAESEDAESEDADSEAAEGSEEAAAGDGAVVEIGTEFTDEETGDVITIVSAVRGNPTEYYMASDNPDGEMIYLEVAVAPGDQFGGVISQQDFLLEDGGEEVNYASTADDELTAAGYDYFDGASRRDGEATGYIPIYVESTGDTLKGAYVRPEAKVLGEDQTIPEFRGEFEIPAV